MKKVKLYDLSPEKPITYIQAVDLLNVGDMSMYDFDAYIMSAAMKYARNYKKKEMQTPQNSQKLAQNINAAVRAIMGCDSKERYEFQSVKYQPGEINNKQNEIEIFNIALFYLEHGNLTEEQRKCLQKIAIKMNGANVVKIVQKLLLAAVLAILLFVYSFYKASLNDMIMTPDVIATWVGSIGLTSGAFVASIYSYLSPFMQIKKLNKISEKQR